MITYFIDLFWTLTMVLQVTIIFHCYSMLILMLLNKLYWTKF